MKLTKSNRLLPLLLVFLFVLVLRSEHRVLFYDLGPDKTRQIIASGNLIQGRGISDCTVTAVDIANVKCVPQTWWPAGYPILLSAVHTITNDFLIADFLLVVMGLLLLFVSLLRIFKVGLGDSQRYLPYHLFLVFSAFSFAPYHYLTTTDLLATAFFIAGCAAAITGTGNRHPVHFVLAGVCIFLSAFLKYSFYPFVVVVPIALSALALIRRDKPHILKIAWYAGSVLIGFLILALTIPQHLINQGAGSIVRGWYWNHLLEFDQFGLKTFFFLEPVISRLNSASIFGSGLSIVTSALSIGLVALCTLSGVRFVHERKHEVTDGELLIALLGVTTVIINIVYLSWLSIRFPTIPQPDNPSWTFVWETRYFTQSMMFILLFVFILPFRLRSSSKLVRKASLAFIALAMAFAGSYWLWKHFDIFWRDRWAGTYRAEKSEDVAIANFLRTRFENQPDTTVLGFSTIASAYGPARIVSSVGNAIGDNFQVGHDEQLKTTKQRTLILKFRKELTDEERKFLDERRGIKILELPNADLYQLEILP